MKRTLIVIALAMALMLVFAAPAFAKYAGYSNTTQYVPWAEAYSLASQNPDAALMDAGPHAGYATTTIKCAVCHSVHRGGNTLLNEGSACAYCHTNAYYGGGAVASDLISWSGAGPHASRCTNTDCHGGPHGVGASAYAGPSSRLLTSAADTKLDAVVAANEAVDAGLVVDLGTWDATTRALATGALCSRDGCHDDSNFAVVSAGATSTVDTGGAITAAVTGHRVIAAATTTWNADSSFPTNKTNITIAYAGVDYCNSCHDLSDDNNGGKAAFPHSINGVVDSAVGADGTWRPAVWLTAGAFAGDTRYAVGPYNQYTGDGTTVAGSAGSSILDGTCLKCHRGSASTGVGFDY